MVQALCRLILKLSGWHLKIERPDVPRYVLIGYPHTSNIDFVLAMLAKGAVDLQFHFVAKHTLFWWPLGALMRALGGIPVDRTRSTGFVDTLVQRFRSAQAQEARFVVGLMPEGTRSAKLYWRSGFYHLACQAEVPVVPAYIDFATKTIGMGKPLYLSGDPSADLDQLRRFYSPIRGRYHDLATPVRFHNLE